MNGQMRWAYAGIFFLAGSIILFQVAMTRVFAIMMWHHFTYMVISVALLGFGAAGSILTARRESERTDSPHPSLVTYSAAYSVAAILAFCFTTQIRVDGLEIWRVKSNFVALLQIYLVLCVPMLLGGLAIGIALTRLVHRVNRLYFWDLLGSGIGGAIAVFVLKGCGNAGAVMVAGTLGAFGAFMFSFNTGILRRVLTFGLFLGLAYISVAYSGGWPRGEPRPDQSIERRVWRIHYANGKEVSFLGDPGRVPEKIIPSTTAEVEVMPPRTTGPMPGGNAGAIDYMTVEARFAAQDGTAPTYMIKDAANYEQFKFLDDSQATTAYVCLRTLKEKDPEVLVIGVGGGVDVMAALYNGAKHVTAVEINGGMIDMVTKHYGDYIGHLFDEEKSPVADRVQLVHAEGRSYMRRQGEGKFDVIQMSGVDSFTALSTGAYTLSESYLYTTDAVKEFYRALTDRGYVNYSRFILNYPHKPRETLRLAHIARTALEELGVDDPASHICVLQGSNWASTMIKKRPFTTVEMDALVEFARVEGFKGLIFNPLHDRTRPLPPSPQTVSNGMVELSLMIRTRIGPAIGVKMNDENTPRLTLAFADIVLAAAAEDADAVTGKIAMLREQFPEVSEAASRTIRQFLPPSVNALRRRDETFLRTRQDYMQLLRGTPKEREDFLVAYEYDVSAVDDDRPFFFNYYKYGQLFDDTDDDKRQTDIYHPDFPVGLWVLVVSLVQIVALAFIMIVMPIRHLALAGLKTRGKLRFLGYFTALGVGFMFIEIVMMQKMAIFLGHPTYALSVVLSSLLVSAGIGSFLAERIRIISRRSLLGLLTGIVTTSIGVTYISNEFLSSFLQWSMTMRVVLVVALISPMGLALGTAFPTGIRLVKQQSPELLPWCWAVNGFLSVFASIFCIVLAMFVGFTVVIWVAAALYVMGFLAMMAGPMGHAEET